MPNSMHYIYGPSKINDLETSLSVPRLSTYVNESVDGEKESALKLYLWNTQISSSLHFPLAMAEITLRNSLHSQLASKYGDDWPLEQSVPFEQREKDSILNAIREIKDSGKDATTSRIVANLSFGFWTGLLRSGAQGAYHVQLWSPTLSKAFPKKVRDRRKIQSTYYQIKELRNRIAHHEPIFKQNLENKFELILGAIYWHGIDTKNWVEHHCTVKECLAKKPPLKS